ncbi:MAG: sortase A [Candidatus Aldehydirespiratoraceae bacterium]|jgi:sortase A
MSDNLPRSAKILGAIGRGLITAGVVVLLFVVFQLWGTNIQEARSQDGLRDEFENVFADAQTQLASFATPTTVAPVDAGTVDELPAPTTTSTLPGGIDPEVLRYFFPQGGDAVARIEIPSIDVDKIVVNGVQVADLRKGPGQYLDTAPVGTEGNSSIAGHRTTYGAPFNRIDELQPGDEIHVTGILGKFTYRVMGPQTAYPEQIHTVVGQGAGHIIVRPGDTWVLGDFRDNRVTLTACHPKLSSRQRIIVAAELVETAVDVPVFDPNVVALLTGEPVDEPPAQPSLGVDEVPTDDALTGTDPITEPEALDLDSGLSGERGAIPGATLWMLGAIFFWVGAGLVGHRLFEERSRRLAVRFVGLLPAACCLWLSFEMIDRALPAG